MTNHDLSRIAERIGADRLEAMCRVAPPGVVRDYGLRWRRSGDAVQMACDRVASINRNRTQGLGLDDPITGDRLADLAAFHRAGGIREFMLQVTPGSAPEVHDAVLRAAGFTWWRRRVLHVRDASPPAPVRCEFEIREVAVADARAFAEFSVAQHDAPQAFVPWAEVLVGTGTYRAFVAWNGPVAVASATMSMGPYGVWFGGANTTPSARRRGTQAALLAARITAARDAGAEWLMVETVEPAGDEDDVSARNCARAGFRALPPRPSWVPARA